ncbi:PEP-CTERM sorting domain-containing protein [Undibacterium sp.]|uniref:PEP-CTERM sorting domain-containing protein n=1 Tax=Undibacterium sp. TaxID=1914977 RepID=UPI0025D36881|nr:PEP-CTERM sorting domain-containing protein [Undibacterium sp.]MCX7218048.1 PEP-CTERM sorting domain-containing protein [Burkholderiales bacterium]
MVSKVTAIAALTLSLFASLTANATQLVSNGGFETGNLSGWTTSGLGSGSCPNANQDWNVSSSSSTGCATVANPSGSTYAAYVMNDGTGPLTYKLTQSIFVAAGTTGGTLAFDWTTSNGADRNRTLSVMFGANEVFNSSTFGGFSWKSVSMDISALLAASAGTNVILSFNNFIPVTWSGPAGLGLDNVAINAKVPEPTTIALLGLGLLGFAAARRRKQ